MISRLIVFISVITFLTSCDGSASRTKTLPGKTGNPNEILVVAPEVLWKSDAGDALKLSLNRIQFGLPQDELVFQSVELKEDGFSDFWITHRNIIKIEIDKSKEVGVKVKHDVYARQQLFALITINKPADLKPILTQYTDQLFDLFYEEEIDRLIERNEYFGSKEFNEKVAEITDLNLVIQEDFFIAKQEKNFLWLRLEREKPIGGYQHQISQGMMVYWRPYTDTLQFSDSSLFAWKDEINMKYVEGPKNSKMTISKRMILPETKFINYNDLTAKEIRGLWRMEGFIMGGPFYSLAFYNPENGRQYMVEGYVYAPQFDKLKFLREIEAMVRSAEPIKSEEVEQ